MHFGFALDLSGKDLSNIGFLDTHLDLSDTDIPSKHFLLSPRRLKDVSKTCLQYVFKNFSA